MNAEWVNAVAAGISAVATLAGVAVAFFALRVAQGQLRDVKNSLRHNTLLAVLGIEAQLAASKEKCQTAAGQLRRATEDGRPLEIEIAKDDLEAAVESWLNALDRLCFCILRDYVPEKEWRAEYRQYVIEAVRANVEHFKAGSPYLNILQLDTRWRLE